MQTGMSHPKESIVASEIETVSAPKLGSVEQHSGLAVADTGVLAALDSASVAAGAVRPHPNDEGMRGASGQSKELGRFKLSADLEKLQQDILDAKVNEFCAQYEMDVSSESAPECRANHRDANASSTLDWLVCLAGCSNNAGVRKKCVALVKRILSRYQRANAFLSEFSSVNKLKETWKHWSLIYANADLLEALLEFPEFEQALQAEYKAGKGKNQAYEDSDLFARLPKKIKEKLDASEKCEKRSVELLNIRSTQGRASGQISERKKNPRHCAQKATRAFYELGVEEPRLPKSKVKKTEPIQTPTFSAHEISAQATQTHYNNSQEPFYAQLIFPVGRSIRLDEFDAWVEAVPLEFLPQAFDIRSSNQPAISDPAGISLSRSPLAFALTNASLSVAQFSHICEKLASKFSQIKIPDCSSNLFDHIGQAHFNWFDDPANMDLVEKLKCLLLNHRVCLGHAEALDLLTKLAEFSDKGPLTEHHWDLAHQAILSLDRSNPSNQAINCDKTLRNFSVNLFEKRVLGQTLSLEDLKVRLSIDPKPSEVHLSRCLGLLIRKLPVCTDEIKEQVIKTLFDIYGRPTEESSAVHDFCAYLFGLIGPTLLDTHPLNTGNRVSRPSYKWLTFEDVDLMVRYRISKNFSVCHQVERFFRFLFWLKDPVRFEKADLLYKDMVVAPVEPGQLRRSQVGIILQKLVNQVDQLNVHIKAAEGNPVRNAALLKAKEKMLDTSVHLWFKGLGRGLFERVSNNSEVLIRDDRHKSLIEEMASYRFRLANKWLTEVSEKIRLGDNPGELNSALVNYSLTEMRYMGLMPSYRDGGHVDQAVPLEEEDILQARANVPGTSGQPKPIVIDLDSDED